MAKPGKLSHLVLQTHDPKRLATWYADLLGAEIVFESPVINLLTYDEEHHRIGFAALPPSDEVDGSRLEDNKPGVSHFAFGYESIGDLLECFENAKVRGDKPVVALHHGMTMSLYYKDPDGNNVETFVECFPTAEAAMGFMASPVFQSNPVGHPLDPDELLARRNAGASDEDLMAYDSEAEVDVMALAEQTMRSLG